MKIQVSQSADGQGVLSLAGVLASKKRDRSGDSGDGGGDMKRGRVI